MCLLKETSSEKKLFERILWKIFNAINYVSIFPDLAFFLFHNFGTNSLRFLKTIRSRRSKVQVTHQRLMTLLADFDWLPDETPFPIQCCGQLHFLHQAFYRFEHLSPRYAVRRRSRRWRIFSLDPPYCAFCYFSPLVAKRVSSVVAWYGAQHGRWRQSVKTAVGNWQYRFVLCSLHRDAARAHHTRARGKPLN